MSIDFVSIKFKERQLFVDAKKKTLLKLSDRTFVPRSLPDIFVQYKTVLNYTSSHLTIKTGDYIMKKMFLYVKLVSKER